MSKALGFNSLKVQCFQSVGFKYQPAPPYIVGSAIAEEAVRRGLEVTCLSRSGAPPSHIAALPWAARVEWKPANALEPDTYKQHLKGSYALITAVGRLPLPSLTHEVGRCRLTSA